MFTFHKLLIYFAARVASGGNANALPGRPAAARPAAPRLPWLCAEGRCWPQSWVLGAQKSGSTTLWSWLRNRAGACGAVVGEGQPSYFDKETHYWQQRAQGLPAEQRAALFTALYPASKRPECPGGFVEATPNNLCDAEPPWRLRAAMPAALRPALRFVVSLREPIARDISYYNHQLRANVTWGNEACPLHRFPSYEGFAACRLSHNDTRKNGLALGFYAEQLERWAASFSRGQIIVFEMSWMLGNTQGAMRCLHKFLRLPPPPDVGVMEKANAAPASQRATLPCGLRDRLQAIYEPRNQQLYKSLAATRRAVPEEPPFPPFQEMPCGRHR